MCHAIHLPVSPCRLSSASGLLQLLVQILVLNHSKQLHILPLVSFHQSALLSD